MPAAALPRAKGAQTAAPLRGIGVRLLPGVGVCVLVSLAAQVFQRGEEMLVGRAWIESLVLAILLGAVARTFWTPGDRWRAGIAFSAKHLLEVAVALLGSAISATALMAVSPQLLVGIPIVVGLAIGISYVLGRRLGVSKSMAMLVACGNSICGNSAIAAAAPVIGASGEEVAAAVGFTAVLGVGVVVGLPMLGQALHLSGPQFGVLAGMTVYAVPQVLAATAPMGPAAVQIGTLVKLVRVLMLGPVCFALSLAPPMTTDAAATPKAARASKKRPPVPWFIWGFVAMACARQFGLIPTPAIAWIGALAGGLTIVSMGALGLETNIRAVARAGGRVTIAVALSLLALAAITAALMWLAGIH